MDRHAISGVPQRDAGRIAGVHSHDLWVHARRYRDPSPPARSAGPTRTPAAPPAHATRWDTSSEMTSMEPRLSPGQNLESRSPSNPAWLNSRLRPCRPATRSAASALLHHTAEMLESLREASNLLMRAFGVLNVYQLSRLRTTICTGSQPSTSPASCRTYGVSVIASWSPHGTPLLLAGPSWTAGAP